MCPVAAHRPPDPAAAGPYLACRWGGKTFHIKRHCKQLARVLHPSQLTSLPAASHVMKQQDLRAPPKWHQRASLSKSTSRPHYRVIDDLRKRRGKIINRVNMRTHVWMIHQSRRKEA